MNWEELFAKRVSVTEDADILKILKLSEQPEIISLAGGMPDPSIYLIDEFKKAADEVITNNGRQVFGYGAIAGIAPFREALAKETTRMGRLTDADEIIVTTGGIAGIDLIAKVLIDPGDVVIVGAPTFTASLHVFRSYQAEIIGIPLDDEGMNADLLAEALKSLQKQGKRAKFIYTIPSFQNPAGVTIPEKRRRQIVALAAAYNIPILEDAAYRQIRFEGTAPPMLAELDPENVMLVNTMSKILNPGMRLGWVAATKQLIDTLVLAKQGQDQCSSTIGQFMAGKLFEKGLVAKQTAVAIDVYHRKRDVMLRALEKYMPKNVSWAKPEGGFFIWLTFPEHIDTAKELDRAVAEESVAYVPGSAFHHDRKLRNCMRLCYTFVSDEKIEEGIARLAKFFENVMMRNH